MQNDMEIAAQAVGGQLQGLFSAASLCYGPVRVELEPIESARGDRHAPWAQGFLSIQHQSQQPNFAQSVVDRTLRALRKELQNENEVKISSERFLAITIEPTGDQNTFKINLNGAPSRFSAACERLIDYDHDHGPNPDFRGMTRSLAAMGMPPPSTATSQRLVSYSF